MMGRSRLIAIGGLKLWQLTMLKLTQRTMFLCKLNAQGKTFCWWSDIIPWNSQVFFLTAPAQWEGRCSGNLSLAIQQHTAMCCED